MAGCSERTDPTPELLPLPQEVVWSKGAFQKSEVSLSGDPSVVGIVGEWLDGAGIKRSDTATGKVNVRLVERIDQAVVNQEEAYNLAVSQEKISIEAVTEKVSIGLSRHCAS